MLEMSNKGQAVGEIKNDFGKKLTKRPTYEHIVMGEETVDQLLEKLAAKGKKVKVLDDENGENGREKL